MRNKFDEQIDTLNNELIIMGALCEEGINGCVKLLTTNDKNVKENIIDIERKIDNKEREIETLCMTLLMKQQPVAKDLRIISSALKMISDLERIGDQAADIAEIVEFAYGSGLDSELHIIDMAKATSKMVTDSIDSFVKKDIDLAKSVIKEDNIVDNYFDIVKSELITTIQNNSEKAEMIIDLFTISKYFERIGDHAENVAEWVLYSILGKHLGERENYVDLSSRR